MESQRRLTKAVVSWGVDGLTALGVTSEAAELSEEERDEALAAIAETAAGRVPLAVGCSASESELVVDRARRARDAGAAAAMVSAPPATAVEELPAFFARVASGAGLPLLVQDEPAATGVVMDVGTLLDCVRASGSRGVKLEHPPTPPKIAEVRRADSGLAVFGGLGGLFALSELRHGAAGTMTGFAFPEILREVRIAVEAGDADRAGTLFDRYLPLLQFEAQPGVTLAVRKELLRRRGAIATAAVRRGAVLDPVTATDLDDVLRRTGVTPVKDQLDLS